VVDIIALIFSERLWLRYMGLTLMIAGAAAAAASYATGDMEGDRIWDQVSGPAKDVLTRHAKLGYYLMCTFAILALWRILVEALRFMNSTRQIYLALALVAVGVLLYQGSLGGELVYTYGVGTGAMAASAVKAMATEPVPSIGAAPSSAAEVPTAVPTVYNPTAEATPAPTEAPTAAAEPTASPQIPNSEKSPEPAASPSV
jgi:uncharacterized membrane protein